MPAGFSSASTSVVIDLTIDEDDNNNTNLIAHIPLLPDDDILYIPPPPQPHTATITTTGSNDEIEFVGEVKNTYTETELQDWRSSLWQVCDHAYTILSAAEGDKCTHCTRKFKDRRAFRVLTRTASVIGARFHLVSPSSNNSKKSNATTTTITTCDDDDDDGSKSTTCETEDDCHIVQVDDEDEDSAVEEMCVEMTLDIGEMVRVSRDGLRRHVLKSVNEEFTGIRNEPLRACVVLSDDEEVNVNHNRKNRSANNEGHRRKGNSMKGGKFRKGKGRRSHQQERNNNFRGGGGRIRKATRTKPKLRVKSKVSNTVTDGILRAAARVNEIAIRRAIDNEDEGSAIDVVVDSVDGDDEGTNSGDGKSNFIGGVGAALLQKMGWRKGEGLGANGDGRKEPIRANVRQRRAGVGRS